MPLSVLTIESVARNLVNYKVSRTIARLVVCMYTYLVLRPVFSRDQSSDKLINFLDSQLDTRDSRLETWYSKLSRIEARGSRLEGLSTYFWAVLYSNICTVENSCLRCLYSRKPVCHTSGCPCAKLSHSPSFIIDKFIDYSSWIINLSLDVLLTV